MWFEEVLYELASLFAILQMSVTWQAKPPYPNWTGYSASLANYAERHSSMAERQLPDKMTLAEWFKAYEQILRSDQYQSDFNG